MAVLKVPREHVKMIYTAITLMTRIHTESIVASVSSTHGSARTLKITALNEVKRIYFCETKGGAQDIDQTSKKGWGSQRLMKIKEQMSSIHNIA